MDGTGELFAPFLKELGSSLETCLVRYPASGSQSYAKLESVARASLPHAGPFVIVAESFSGPIGVSLAQSLPSGMVGLVLCCTFVRNPRPGLRWLRPLLGLVPLKFNVLGLRDRILLGRFASPKLRAALTAALSGVSSSTFRARLAAVMAVDVSSKLRILSLPMLYLRASEDRVVPRAVSSFVVSQSSCIREFEVPGPHCLLQATPGESARAITDFVHELQRVL